ncbi:N-formylglutamate amidohydrolase [Pontibacter roseus]|uniref:N-formylglutamate amidohydrolase n=1 Tax=Pontibacter roseus TaxID=336989 RepID=UPI0003613E58|nr:N-formylglutamate amidohydrolase [Pontibacter roseus]
MSYTYILTCEHAGNEVPKEYAHLFKGKEEVLYTHQAIDFGALRLARYLAAETDFPLYLTTTSRLLVEANRSLDNEELFSEYSRKLSEKERQIVLGKHYYPHRRQVEKKIEQALASGEKVIHLAIHTFTPVLDGEVRPADIGILFDPERPLEAAFAQQLQDALQASNPERKVLFNSPYPGTDDGLPTYLRTKFGPDHYTGFELEVNQKYFLNGEPAVWEKIMKEITSTVQSVTFAFHHT